MDDGCAKFGNRLMVMLLARGRGYSTAVIVVLPILFGIDEKERIKSAFTTNVEKIAINRQSAERSRLRRRYYFETH